MEAGLHLFKKIGTPSMSGTKPQSNRLGTNSGQTENTASYFVHSSLPNILPILLRNDLMLFFNGCVSKSANTGLISWIMCEIFSFNCWIVVDLSAWIKEDYLQGSRRRRIIWSRKRNNPLTERGFQQIINFNLKSKCFRSLLTVTVASAKFSMVSSILFIYK